MDDLVMAAANIEVAMERSLREMVEMEKRLKLQIEGLENSVANLEDKAEEVIAAVKKVRPLAFTRGS